MVKIEIKHECTDIKELSVLLRHIADMVDKGEMYGYTPTWTVTDISEKTSQIEYIKDVINKWGATTSAELELDSSPVFNNISGKVCSLIESFTFNYVTVVTYDDELEIEEENIRYEDLSDELIDEIHTIMEIYDTREIELYDSIRDENI